MRPRMRAILARFAFHLFNEARLAFIADTGLILLQKEPVHG